MNTHRTTPDSGVTCTTEVFKRANIRSSHTLARIYPPKVAAWAGGSCDGSTLIGLVSDDSEIVVEEAGKKVKPKAKQVKNRRKGK